MVPGSIFFDRDFHFNDGESGEKLFVALGNQNGIHLVAKTTSKQHGRGTTYGCQADRFFNFFLPKGCCYLKESTWVCLNEFYLFNSAELLQKRFGGTLNAVCTLDDVIFQQLVDCAKCSEDISEEQLNLIS
ncbi:hypothetical protein CWE13_00315 [Aliidiomarina shirensis]|uniref:Uncharacterized protein n=1 Tax=Aliidiomarina shirensis TaxID=1048642 RepID=A0A432WWI5_9GAMM|nr:hypothetical protein [Aliidiomarina shirensis]RUO38132.1 hypothetical protein CWE13_00315 [Aliidiomarina shirensis]